MLSTRLRSILAAFALTCATEFSTVDASDFAVVPLLDGERASLLNNWGGPFCTHNINGISLETGIVHSGNASYRADLGTIPASDIGFFQTFSSETTSTEAAR